MVVGEGARGGGAARMRGGMRGGARARLWVCACRSTCGTHTYTHAGHGLRALEPLWSRALHLLPFGWADDSYLHHGLGRERPL